MYCSGFVYDPNLVLVSFSAESTTLLSLDIQLWLKAIHHFLSYFRFWPKVKFLLFYQEIT